jgi:hypothetical protein
MRTCNRSRLLVAAFMLVALVLADQTARAQMIGVFADQNPNSDGWCHFSQAGSQGSLYVIYYGGPYSNGDYKTVRFAVSVPTAPTFFVIGAWVMGQGDVPVSTLQSGVTVPLGSCRSDAVTVARLDYFRVSPPPACTVIKVIPDPSASSGKVEFTRCDDEMVYLNEGNIGGDLSGADGGCPAGPANPPSNPVPANGATGVNLDADLSVLIHWPSFVLGCRELYGEGSRLFFGTDPNPPLISAEGDTSFPFDVGPLQPATTYYWRVTYLNTLGATGISPTWSFRTAAPIATEASTWGRVKAMYRD